jgi:hypothetical protein
MIGMLGAVAVADIGAPAVGMRTFTEKGDSRMKQGRFFCVQDGSYRSRLDCKSGDGSIAPLLRWLLTHHRAALLHGAPPPIRPRLPISRENGMLEVMNDRIAGLLLLDMQVFTCMLYSHDE